VALASIGAAVLYVACSLLWPKAFWSSDSALKMLQVDALAHGRVTLAYPGQDIDPTAEWAPMHGAFFLPAPDGLRLVWPLGFAALSLPFYLAFGRAGLYVLPALCGAGTVYAAGRLAARLSRRGGALAAGAVAVASPVLIYAVSFWEHVVAACLTTFGVLALTGERALLGGALLALAAGGLRAEVYTLIGAIGLATLVTARPRLPRFVAGVAIGSVPMWLANLSLTGHAIPLNAARNFSHVSSAFFQKAGIVRAMTEFLILPSVPWERPFIAAATMALCLALLLHERHRALMPIAASLAVLLGLFAFGSQMRAVDTLPPTCHGVLQGCALVPFAAGFRPSQCDSPRVGRLLAVAVVAYAPLYLVALCLTSDFGPAGGFSEWGPRFFLPFFPLAVPLATTAWLQVREQSAGAPLWDRWVGSTGAVALGFVSLCLAFTGFVSLRDFSVRLTEVGRVFASAPGDLVSDTWSLPLAEPLTIVRKPSFWAVDYDAFLAIVNAERMRGIRELTLASFYDARNEGYLQIAELEGRGIRVLRDEPTRCNAHAIALALASDEQHFAGVRFGEGFSFDEWEGNRHWRWLGASGELSLAPPPGEPPVEMDFTAVVTKDALEADEKPVVVTFVEGEEVDRFEAERGPWLRRIPLHLRERGWHGDQVNVRFQISRVHQSPVDGRSMGMALTGIRLSNDAKTLEATAPRWESGRGG
jgi:hypothetical protein